jgi:[acyl-carrier-protein] S-malonyltransferase
MALGPTRPSPCDTFTPYHPSPFLPPHLPFAPAQSLMEPARAALEAVLATTPVRAPRVPVISNVTAAPFPADPDAIRALLGRQLVEPVQWEATLAALTAPLPSAEGGGASSESQGAGEGAARKLFELGPGAQIKSMVRRVDGAAWKAMANVSAA